MSDEQTEKRDIVLNINFEINKEDVIFVRYAFVPRFLSHLKENNSHRERFISELIERLNGYIDGDENE
jgi:hypothetical protein